MSWFSQQSKTQFIHKESHNDTKNLPTSNLIKSKNESDGMKKEKTEETGVI